jgi:DNA mismatch repair protein MSH2
LVKLPKLISDLDAHESPKKKVLTAYFVDPLNGLKEDCSNFVEMIETTLDLKLADQGEFMIRPDFDDTLQG